MGERTRVLHRWFQFIEPVTFAHCTFIFALRKTPLGGYLDTRRNINLEHLRHDLRPEIYILYIYIVKIRAIEQTMSSLCS